MSTAAAMKNENILSNMAESIDNVHLNVNALKTIAWLMRCTLEETVPRPKGVSYYGSLSLVLDIIERHVAQIDGDADTARAALHEYMQASR